MKNDSKKTMLDGAINFERMDAYIEAHQEEFEEMARRDSRNQISENEAENNATGLSGLPEEPKKELQSYTSED